VRRFSTSVVAACVVVGPDHFSPEVEIELPLVRCGGVLGGLEHLWVGEFFAQCNKHRAGRKFSTLKPAMIRRDVVPLEAMKAP